MMKSREHARGLLAKANEDLYVLERLVDDADSPDAVIGFHAQQAVEKSLSRREKVTVAEAWGDRTAR